MKARLLNIGAFYKYKSVIDKKNIWGMWWNFTMFEGLIILDFIMKAFVGPERMNPVYIIYAVLSAATMAVWYRIRTRIKKAQDWSIIIAYIIAMVFVSHCMFMYGTDTIIAVYAVFLIDLAATFLMHPSFLIMGQTEAMAIFMISYFFCGKHVTLQGVMLIVLSYVLAVTVGLLIWNIRLANVVFDNELIFLATGTDDVFLENEAGTLFDEKEGSGIFCDINDRKKRTFTFIFNTKTDRVISVREGNIFSLRNRMTWDEVTQRILRYAADPASYRLVEKFLDKETILTEFAKGNDKTNLEAGFNISGGEKMWLRFEMSLRPHPVSGFVMNAITIEDVTADHIYKELLNHLISQNYDAVLCIEKGRKGGILFLSEPDKDFQIQKCDDYEDMLVDYVAECIADHDRERVMREGHLKNILDNLKDRDMFEYFADEYSASGEIRKMRFISFYLEEDKKILVLLRQDITSFVKRAREAREKLEKALEEAKSANEVRNEFLSRMSHEMRTPMNAIIGLTALMEEDRDDPASLLRYAEKVKTSGDYLLQLVNNMFDMSELSGGLAERRDSECTFGDIFGAVETMIGSMCETKGIEYRLNSEVSDKTTIKADKFRLIQILTNVLENSVKYTNPGGKIELNCYSMGLDSGIGSYRFVIKDNGVGMSEEFAQHIFDPYRRENEKEDPINRGAGLGLLITKGILDMLGGKISATSKPGVGTTVVIDLDLSVIDTVHKTIDPGYDISRLRGKKILVVEDNEINREIVCELLKKRGVLVDEAVNGEAAVKKFSESEEDFYDAILMDIRMPGMNGLEATSSIRSMVRSDASKVAIISMTANAFSEDVELTADSRMNAHLSKPINPNILYETLIKTINN